VQLPKQTPAKLPLPQAEIARINRFREILGNTIEMANTVGQIVHDEMVDEAQARKAARAVTAAANTAAAQPTVDAAETTAPLKAQKPNPQTAAGPSSQTPPPAEDLKPRGRASRAKPEAFFLSLIRVINDCMRLDAWFAEKLVNGHTTADLAGLYHPNRQPILDYLHSATRAYQPYQLQRMMNNDLETRITQELAWAPERNPGDLIAEIATQYGLAHNPADYPNNWRPAEFDPAPYESNADLDDPPPNPKPKDILDYMVTTVLNELANHGSI
jgi:hypothetical protein